MRLIGGVAPAGRKNRQNYITCVTSEEEFIFRQINRQKLQTAPNRYQESIAFRRGEQVSVAIN